MTVVYIRLVVEACTTCRGTGEVLAGGPAGGGHATRPKRCPKCDGSDAFDIVDKLLDGGVPQDSINRRGLRVTSATSHGERDVIRALASASPSVKAARDAFERCDEAWRAAGPLAPHDLVMERLRFLDELVGAAKADAMLARKTAAAEPKTASEARNELKLYGAAQPDLTLTLTLGTLQQLLNDELPTGGR